MAGAVRLGRALSDFPAADRWPKRPPQGALLSFDGVSVLETEDMVVGIPKEMALGERRVAAVPETVAHYIELGFDVLVEATAGDGALCTQAEYERAGALTAAGPESLYAESDIVLKVRAPCHNDWVGRHEVQMMRRGTVLIAFDGLTGPSANALLCHVSEKGITSFALGAIPRLVGAQRLDAAAAMGAVAGYGAVLSAASRFPRLVPALGTVFGSNRPARFLVIGVGTVGLQAVATAQRLGGMVAAVDTRATARRAAASLGARLPAFDIPQHVAADEGDHARRLPAKWLEKEREVLAPVVAESDILILCASVHGEAAPVLITEGMVARMRPGSVIVDVAVDEGGNCDLTEPGLLDISRNGVRIAGPRYIPNSVPADASRLYSHSMFEFVKTLFRTFVTEMDLTDPVIRSALVTHAGVMRYDGAWGTRAARGLRMPRADDQEPAVEPGDARRYGT
jgi:NAD(P) transhydrogenase subunit alpha